LVFCGCAIALSFLYDASQQTCSVVLAQPGYVQYTLAALRV
jgi:hypothetical protein